MSMWEKKNQTYGIITACWGLDLTLLLTLDIISPSCLALDISLPSRSISDVALPPYLAADVTLLLRSNSDVIPSPFSTLDIAPSPCSFLALLFKLLLCLCLSHLCPCFFLLMLKLMLFSHVYYFIKELCICIQLLWMPDRSLHPSCHLSFINFERMRYSWLYHCGAPFFLLCWL